MLGAHTVLARPATSPRLLAVVVMCVLALVLPLTPAGAQPTEQEVRQRLESVEAERDALRGQLEEAEAERDAVSVELDRATARVDELTAELAATRDQVTRLQREIDALDVEVRGHREVLGTRIRALYQGALPNEYVGVLTGQSPADLAARSHYLVALSENDRGQIEVAAATSRRLATRRGELAATEARVDQLASAAAEAQAELDAQLAAAAGTVDGLSDEVADRDAEAQRLAAEAEELRRAAEEAARQAAAEEAARQAAAEEAERAEAERAEAERAEAAAAERRAREPAASRSAPRETAATPAPASGSSGSGSTGSGSSGGSSSGSSGGSSGGSSAPSSGGKACPQGNPRSFSDTWGAPRSGGRRHQGTDIFGRMDGPVYAITSGTVQWTRTGGSAGLFLSLRGDDGHTYWYMHLNRFHVGAGARVSAGQLIATNGDTGNARGTTPHIHFEYHPGGGGPANPYPLLRQLCG